MPAYPFNLPAWADPKQASVFDPIYVKALRAMAQLWGANDPAQIMAIGGQMDVPEGKGLAGHIKAYHGSPYDFERFDTSKIGTGEGAQAYGHGLYFAEKEGTAKAYRDALSFAAHSGTTDQAQMFFDELAKGGTIEGKVPFGRNATLYSPEQMRDAFVSGKVNAFDFPPAIQKRVEQAINTKGKMYEVAIKAHPDQFLDWDKPLSQQSAHVKDALAPIIYKDLTAVPVGNGMNDIKIGRATLGTVPDARLANEDLKAIATSLDPRTGDIIYQHELARTGANASQKLKETGIAGIKYLDQGSRAAGEGSRNFVVFDDKTVDILKKYGLLLPAAGATAAEAAKPRDVQSAGALKQ